MMIFKAIMGGALGDRALPEAHGKTDVYDYCQSFRVE
jgi:hypothetical protein